MLKNSNVITHFENQANACAKMNSPFTANLCSQLITVLDDKTAVGRRINSWQGDAAADALALRMCAALQSIVIRYPKDTIAKIYQNSSHPEYTQILTNSIAIHDEVLNDWLDEPPQTNETGRSAALLLGLLEISRQTSLPIHLAEIGASAGLNLQLDKFSYQFHENNWGNPNSPVKLSPVLKGSTANLSGSPTIISRIGCDLNPLDIQNEHHCLRLRSYVWPDQQYRKDRLNGAISIALDDPPSLIKQDAASFVEDQLKNRPTNTAFVLMHSVVWQYLPAKTQQRIFATLEKHGNEVTDANPIFWLRMEGFGGKENFARVTVDQWPNHTHHHLANSCFHASWIEFK